MTGWLWSGSWPQAGVIAVDDARHLWVGEPYVRIVLNEIVRQVNPAALVGPSMTLPADPGAVPALTAPAGRAGETMGS